MPPKPEKKQRPWWTYFWAFLVAFGKHWWTPVATTFGGAGCYFTERISGMIPGWAISAIVASGFLVAAFRAWLDERRKYEAVFETPSEKQRLRALVDRFSDQLDTGRRLLGQNEAHYNVEEKDKPAALEWIIETDAMVERDLSKYHAMQCRLPYKLAHIEDEMYERIKGLSSILDDLSKPLSQAPGMGAPPHSPT